MQHKPRNGNFLLHRSNGFDISSEDYVDYFPEWFLQENNVTRLRDSNANADFVETDFAESDAFPFSAFSKLR
jgi:hypothetical protein